ncbi:MAG: hypothetical protein ACREVS_08970 [Burkholderiales bacterium]
MAALDRILDGVREVLRLTDEVKRLSEGLKELAVQVREIDRRLVRIETLAEIAKVEAGRKRLTKEPPG